MKKILVLFFGIMLIGATAASANCVLSYLYGHWATGYVDNITNNAAIYDGQYWTYFDTGVAGQAEDGGYAEGNWYYTLGGNSAYIFGDWGNPQSTFCPDTGDNMVVALSWQYNETQDDHYGEYVVFGCDWDLGVNGYNMDGVAGSGTGNDAMAMPVVTTIGTPTYTGTDIEIPLTWGMAVAEYVDAGATWAGPLVEGYRVYYATGATTPTTGVIAATWTNAPELSSGNLYFVGNATVAGTIVVPDPGLGNNVYLAMAPIFSDNFGTIADSNWFPMVGANSFAGAGSAGGAVAGGGSGNPATVTSFKAAAGADNSVDLTWNTAAETGFLGFNVYRSTDNVHFDILNDRLIDALGVAGGGASYSFADYVGGAKSTISRSAKSSRRTRSEVDQRTIYYKLELVNSDGTTSFISSTLIDLGGLRLTR
jgi:hypothetical protein